MKIVTKSEKVPILGIFSPKTILMFRVGLKKIRGGRPTGTTHTFHLSLRYTVFDPPFILSGNTDPC